MASVYEEKKISKAIMRVGLPSMLGQLTTLIYNIADTFFVSLIREGTVGLVLGNVINMASDYVFIAIFGWRTAGAALATSLGFACASVYYIVCMIREERCGNQLVPLSFRRFSPNAAMIRRVVSIGIPGALITVLMSVSNIVLSNYIGIYGSDAVASYDIAYKLDMIPILLSVGLSQGVVLLNHFWKLDGVIAAQPVVETVLTVICLIMYIGDNRPDRD